MRRKLKFVAITIVAVTAIMSILAGTINNAINNRDGQQALAIDQPVSNLSPELKEAVARAGPTELVTTWVEFDGDELENRTGYCTPILIKRYLGTAEEKLGRDAFSELLPEEIMAHVCYYDLAVRPPIELKKRQPYLRWYVADLLPSMIKSVDGFPGIQRITLREQSSEASGIDWLLACVITKVVVEYPSCKILLSIELGEQINFNTGEIGYNYETISDVVQKYGGRITERLTAVHSMTAEVPPSFQLIRELCALDGVSAILPDLTLHMID